MGCAESEKGLPTKLPVKISVADVNKSPEGNMRQIFTMQGAIITLTYSFQNGTFINIKGEASNVRESYQLWKKILGAKFEKVKNGY